MTHASLRHGVMWAAAGNGIYVACQYGMLMALARLGTIDDVGTFALALAITAPIVIFSQMQLRQVLVTDTRGEAGFADYLASRLVSASGALLATGVIVLLTGYDRRTMLVILGVAAAKAFESVADIMHGRLQRMERLDLVAVSLALKGVLSLVVFVLALAGGGNLLAAVVAMALAWGGTLVLVDLLLIVRTMDEGERWLSWQPSTLARLARTATPLAFASSLGSLSAGLPRYFLEGFEGTDAVALFSVAATPLAVLALVGGAISQATLPRAAHYFASGQHAAFGRLVARTMVLQFAAGAAVSLVLWAHGETVMQWLFTPEYRPAGPVAALMAAGVTLGAVGVFGATVLAAGRRFSLQFWNVAVMVAAQVPLCVLLIRWGGLWGAAWSEVARYGVSAVFLIVVGRAVLRRAATS